jgi:hypothetical protein
VNDVQLLASTINIKDTRRLEMKYTLSVDETVDLKLSSINQKRSKQKHIDNINGYLI